ncbi:tRNA (adenosine(37)-N6)-threonylcarbamoyltransferase complex dimerization subunit type 1 TsaB [Falsibacillus pallidus]|uniref:tRNA threonylcarbamoyladenosine biosynthesis protein TsaB n=1 Tax=Falsibacillus pallidus TaxID=493781 RepID=A0A370G510_9BACI|nr:tRNA (adenosine(37)-N6)-threonylcarbamoyltransferase complex dimerization subunit type 1 TsaB [Falsibacillus pallidus]RDI37909.1 tRNA threonylcarbamoyladenosine biosynthesis protein TsaB [Falsibacillus pallidus]
MKVLAIDTSNYTLGLALMEEDLVIGEYITTVKKNHSIRVMPAIDMLLKDCDAKPADLSKIVVALGPGSYTGVRIGMTIAKTLAWSLDIPISGVSSLAFLAASGRNFDGLICPLFDARRGQVYTGLYEFRNGELEEIQEDCNVMLVDWVQSLKEMDKPVLFVGNDVPLHREKITEILGGMAHFAGVTQNNPRPSELALLGMNAEPANVHTIVPNYVRLAEAEAKWLEAQKAKE